MNLKQTALVQDLTVTLKGAVNYPQRFVRDSDAEVVKAAGQAVIKVVTGDNSQTNHGLDIGLMVNKPACVPICVPLVVRKI
jgi:hypothetical protein